MRKRTSGLQKRIWSSERLLQIRGRCARGDASEREVASNPFTNVPRTSEWSWKKWDKSEFRRFALGRKVNPIGFRLGIIKEHKARWYAEGQVYSDLLAEDLAVRDLIYQANERASVSS